MPRVTIVRHQHVFAKHKMFLEILHRGMVVHVNVGHMAISLALRQMGGRAGSRFQHYFKRGVHHGV